VGPRDDGTIPQIQLDRLNDLGTWLNINKEGIYDSKTWKTFGHKTPDGLDVRFTRKGNNLYVFIFNLPRDKTLHIPGLRCASNAEAIVFGNVLTKIGMVRSDGGVDIKVPENLKPSLCTMLKITNVED
jgi:alpha-L-fucosidase